VDIKKLGAIMNNGHSFFPKKVKKRKKMGRPRIKSQDRRSVSRDVSLRVNEARKLDALAKQAGKTFSTWAREVLLEVVGSAG
jgi:hypothetical protein